MNQSRKKRPTTHRSAPLRERAEALLKESPTPDRDWCGDDPRNLVYELRVHQAELEMQNEELRRAQIDLETSRDRFAHLYDLAPVGYLTLGPKGVIREANRTAARLLGLDHRALLNQNLTAFIAAGSQDGFYLHRQKVFAAVDPQSCELQMRRGEGEFTCRLESVVESDGKGVASHCLVAMSDVTRQRQAEEAMRKSRAQLAGIVRSAMDAIITVNSRQRIILCNEAAERMFGHPSGRLVGRTLRDLIPKTARRTHARWVRTFGTTEVTNGKMDALDQVYGLRADGTEFPIEASVSQVELGGEKLFTAVLRDITERLRAEETLRRSESELADFFANSPLGMLWVGGDGRVLRVNRAFLGMLGYSEEEEVVDHSIAEFHPDPEVASAALERLAHRETSSSHRALLRHKDGSLRHVSINANGLWEATRLVHSRWFVTDKTRQADLEREILAISELEQQRLGRELHDDICQQLTCIEFLAHGLEQELAAKSTTSPRRASQIARLLRETNSRVRDLSHGLAPIHMDAGGLIDALQDLALRTRRMFGSNCTVLADKTVAIDDPEVRLHLYRIAQEAVSNAVKHGRAKRIDIRLKETGDRLVLGVHDNGSGLPVNPRRAKGLGLRLMEYRAGLIRGSVAVQREDSGGTSVVCSLHSSSPRPQEGKNQ